MAGRISVAGVIIALLIGTLAWNAWGRWSRANVTVSIDNQSATSTLVRVTDASSGRALGTVRVDAGARTVIGPVRLDVWWRDPSVPEQAAGLADGLRLELLTAQCDLLGQRTGSHPDESLTLLDGEGLVSLSTDEALAVLPVHPAAAATVEDPCHGARATPVARVANEWPTPIVLNGRIRVAGCSSLLFRPGDLAALPPVAAEPGDTVLTADSITAQGSRWPIEPRLVHIVGNPGDPPWVEDYPDDAFPGWSDGSNCASAALSR